MKKHYSLIHRAAVVFLVLGAYFLQTSSVMATMTYCYEPCGEESDFRQTTEGLDRPSGLENDAILNLNSTTVNLAFSIGSSAVTQIGGTVKDSDGNYIVTGGFTGTIEFGSQTITSSKDYDFFIAKYDNSGDPVWIRTATGLVNLPDYLSVDGGIALTVNPTTGEIYVGGTFVKSMQFLDGDQAVVASLSDGRNDNLVNYELFVAKYDAAGELEWALGGESGSNAAASNLNEGRNMITSIILDDDGYPYVGGRFSGTNLFGETVSVSGMGDFFLASLDSDGSSPFWVSIAGTPGDDVITSLSIDGLGYINVLGVLGEGLVEFPNSSVTYENGTGNYDTFVMSYDINGDWYYVSFLGAGEEVVGNDVASNLDGSMFVAGQFKGEASFVGSNIVLESDSAIDCVFLVKYDLQGDALWAVRSGGTHYAKANRVVNDAEGNAYVYGIFSEMAIFGIETAAPDTLYSNGITDMFLMKYDADGNYQWVRRLDGSETESLDLISSLENNIRSNPTQMVYSDVNGPEIILSGDFNGTLFGLTAPTDVRLGFVAAIDVSEIVTGVDENAVASIGLLAYPNPMNGEGIVQFSLDRTEVVTAELTNAIGQKVSTLASGSFGTGQHRVSIDRNQLVSGIYFCTINTSQTSETVRLVLL
ncbi:MAG: T9SS type A sorting domain-containing protein [Flavobacteriales bacterium]|nr:T9SS type A sorting domain-containing protein [Flavobacteriales bacterium]